MNKHKEYLHNINVFVHGANGLQTKSGKHKFFIKFGVGKNKSKSQVIEDVSGNPVFNSEAQIGVNDLDEKLKFKVIEKSKNEVLGQVLVHLSDLNEQRTFIKDTVPLRPHKKCMNPSGQLIFEAWIDSSVEKRQLASSVSTESLKSASSLQSGLRKIKNKITNKTNNAESLSSNMARLKQTSYSCQDVSTKTSLKLPNFFAKEETHNDSNSSVSLKKKFSVFHSRENLLETKNDLKPIITGLSPSSVDADVGGAKVTIRGENLGTDLSDITRVLLYGCDVLTNLQYVSSTKIICTTVPWRSGSGHVVVETKSGGRGVSDVEFTFKTEANNKETNVGIKNCDEENFYETVYPKDGENEPISETDFLPQLPATGPPVDNLNADFLGSKYNIELCDAEKYKIVDSACDYSEVLKASEYEPWNAKVFDTIEEALDEEEDNAYQSIGGHQSQSEEKKSKTDLNENVIVNNEELTDDNPKFDENFQENESSENLNFTNLNNPFLEDNFNVYAAHNDVSIENSTSKPIQNLFFKDNFESKMHNFEDKKEKSTDCDSALIPLLCVHG